MHNLINRSLGKKPELFYFHLWHQLAVYLRSSSISCRVSQYHSVGFVYVGMCEEAAGRPAVFLTGLFGETVGCLRNPESHSVPDVEPTSCIQPAGPLNLLYAHCCCICCTLPVLVVPLRRSGRLENTCVYFIGSSRVSES